jgi:hypothetical protein
MKAVQSLDPIVAIGLLISIATGLLLVLVGNDAVTSLIVSLLITIITLIVDLIARLNTTQANVLQAVSLGSILNQHPELHKALGEIAKSYVSVQGMKFDLFRIRGEDALLECRDVLGGLENGFMTVEVAGKYSYGRRGTANAKAAIKAVAYEDVETWRTEHLRNVIRTNAEAAKRGVNIQRVFIIDDRKVADARDVLQAHREAGVHVMIVSPADIPNPDLLESFMLVDDKVLVVFNYTRDGRKFRSERISIDPVEVGRFIDRFSAISRRATEYDPVASG